MFNGLKKFLVNFGLNLLVKKGFDLLEEQKVPIVTYLEDQVIKLVNKLPLEKLQELGISMEDAKLLKDRGVFLARAIILVLINALLRKADELEDTIVASVKV